MTPITLNQPQKIVFGANVLNQLPADCQQAQYKKILLLVASPLLGVAQNLFSQHINFDVEIIEYNFGEPTIDYFNNKLAITQNFDPDCVIGIGGGSVLDTAKLLAALTRNKQTLSDILGKNLLLSRHCALICVPTTAGTGSEVSPNAILLDEQKNEKTSVISPLLMPDACYIDPVLALGLPPKITAETAMDALSHCIEAFTNKFSHPIVDNYALAGIKLIAENLEKAFDNGKDIDARAALALGSMYGGLCLGPVNTAAVHALSYGLGGKYHISHGLANAMLLPEVMHFNLPACENKFSEIAAVIGEKSAVTRLLTNNPRSVTRADAIMIYETLF